jgi:hypothetical protein
VILVPTDVVLCFIRAVIADGGKGRQDENAECGK